MLLFKKRNNIIESNKKLPYSGVINELLTSRGINTAEEAEDFLNPSIKNMYSPFLLKDMDKLVKLINQGISNQKRFVIYGDYDCDGVCAIVILYKTLKSLGANVDYFIPNRADGYGLNNATINRLSKTYDFLVTVDLGITNVEEVELAKSFGMTVIITDHHQIPDELPNADVIIHPAIEPYPFDNLCGAGVAYKIASALIDKHNLKSLIQYAAIATVADIVPLIDENRIIVSEGLKEISNTENLGISALLNNIKIKQDNNIKTSQIAFQIAPRINAAGRVDVADLAVDLFLSDNSTIINELAEKIEFMNNRRKELENIMITDAINQANKIDLTQNKIIFVSGNNWHNGVIGLVAGKLCEIYNLPVIALSINDSTATGSVRSISGVNIYSFLKRCESFFIKWGGHEQAAGITIPVENLEVFKERINKLISDEIDYKTFIPIKTYDIEIDLCNTEISLAEELEKFSPTGFGNPSPLFLTNNLRIDSARKVGVDGKHLKLTINNGKSSRDAIAFNYGDYYDNIPEFMDCIYSVNQNTFNGKTYVSLDIKAIRPTLNSYIGMLSSLSDSFFDTFYIEELCNTILKFNRLNNYEGNIVDNVKDVSVNDIYGTLFVAFTKETAINTIESNYGIIDLYINGFNAKEPYNSLVVMPDWDKIPNGYRTIVMLDGAISNDYINNIYDNYLCDQIIVINSKKINDINKTLLLKLEDYRKLYRLIASNKYYDIASLSKQLNALNYQIAYGLKIFESLNLLTYNLSPFNINLNLNPTKCNIEDSIFIKVLK